MADEELLSWKKVRVNLKKEDLPGKPERIVRCVACGEKVFDGKDIAKTPANRDHSVSRVSAVLTTKRWRTAHEARGRPSGKRFRG